MEDFKYQTCIFLGRLMMDQEHQSSEQSLATYKDIGEFIPFIALGLPSGDVVANSLRGKKESRCFSSIDFRCFRI